MNRFRRLLLIAAINDYDPFPPPLFSADLRAYVYICTRETMERALRSSIEGSSREEEREKASIQRATMAKNVHTRAGKTGDVV